MVVRSQGVVTVFAAFRNLDDGAVELIIEIVLGQVKGSGRSIEGQDNFICIGQFGHDCDFHALYGAIGNLVSPGRADLQ